MDAGFSEAGVARSRSPGPPGPQRRSVSRSATHSRRAGSELFSRWGDSLADRRYRSMGGVAPVRPRRPRAGGLVHLLGSHSSTASPAAASRFPGRAGKSRARTLAPAWSRGGTGRGVADALSVSSLGRLVGLGGARGFRGRDYSAGHASRKAPLDPSKRAG